ncbi:MAG: tail fiber protein [Bacteroidia bacterium]|nr:tail fiber protein [Bacteroidia bacterium]NNF29883.1 phage tail protein [Flavobacteriaceae bacterium]NNK54178.1 phage tail protein [Flavobacteriaceae bacterium]
MDGVLAVIWMFGGNFAPRGWALCDGQLLSINQNQALFSLLGTTYGGDGRTTFGLPELRGRVPMHAGNGPGLTPRPLGQRSGVETVTLTTAQIPGHIHPTQVQVSNTDGEEDTVSGKIISNHAGAFNEDAVPGQLLGGVNGGSAGGNQSHTNIQPFNTVNFVICLQGIFPSRS